jgi:hypothetical protein
MRQAKSRRGIDRDFDEPIKHKRGPHTELSDAQIQNRRDQLIQLFEGDWPRLGGEFQRCKKPDDLIRVFSPLLNSYAQETISTFCNPSDEVGTGRLLRKVRGELRSIVEPSYAVDESKRRASRKLRETDWALSKAPGASRRIVYRARKKHRKEAWKAEQRYRTLSSKEHDLKARLHKLEASFARHEIFRFLRSKRYDINPLSLAKALANLPYSGWRQSLKRSSRTPSGIGDGLNHQIFKAIRFLTASANRQSENTMAKDFRAGLPSLPSRHRVAKVELAKKWFFLERAIRHAYKAVDHPRRLHFAIAEQYFKNVCSANAVENVEAENQAIQLIKRSGSGGFK